MLIVVQGPPTVALEAAHKRGITTAAYHAYNDVDAKTILYAQDAQHELVSDWYCEEAPEDPPPDGTCLYYARAA